MLKNYFKIAFRSLQKNFIYSIINLTGLSIGLASFLLIVIWIINEVSYDKYNEHAERIFRASMEFGSQGVAFKTSVSPTAMLPTLQQMPEVEKGVRIYHQNFNPPTVKVGDELFKEANFYYADSLFFEIFTVEVLKGSDKVLWDPSRLALSEKLAEKYFGENDALGQVIEVGGAPFTVGAVYKNMPPNSHFHADLLVPFSSLPASKNIQWGSANYGTYFLLHENSSLATLDDKVNKKLQEDINMPMTADNYMKVNFIKVTDIHLYSDAAMEIQPKGSVTYIYIFISIALRVLVIAGINYMNLASARAAERAREVGVRKVMGAYKKQLFGQFIGESLFLTLLAGIIALVLVQLAMPLFSNIAGFTYNITDLLDWRFTLGFILILLIVAFSAGSYPAFVLSSFTPQTVLKGNFSTSESGTLLRKVLVIFQFIITVVLITSTLIIYQQLNYVQNTALGFEKDRVIELNYKRSMHENYQSLYNSLKNNPAIANIARGSDSPVGTRGGYTMEVPSIGDDYSLMVTGLAADEHYVNTLGMTMKSGRSFVENDWNLLKEKLYSFIINEATQDALLISDEEIVGTEINVNGRNGKIVGVVKDFHYSGLQEEIKPLVMFLEYQYNNLFIKLAPGDIRENIAAVELLWSGLMPDVPFEYNFLDQEYNSLYIAEERVGGLFFIFAILAVAIASLGLFGLISFLAIKKAKEIGIRKVMGASVTQLILMLSKDFAKLVLVAFILSIPVGWYIMDLWLNNFAYRINISALPFIGAGVLAMIIGLLTVSYQSYRAAIADPVKSLKSE